MHFPQIRELWVSCLRLEPLTQALFLAFEHLQPRPDKVCIRLGVRLLGKAKTNGNCNPHLRVKMRGSRPSNFLKAFQNCVCFALTEVGGALAIYFP